MDKAKWELKVHVDLSIGLKGFLMIIFTNLDDHSLIYRIIEGPLRMALIFLTISASSSLSTFLVSREK